MHLEEILTPQRCYPALPGISKKRLITTVSELLAEDLGYLSANEIFNSLMAREQLGSTGLGNGIAIPHCRVSECRDVVGALVTLDKGIDFNSVDSKPVDLIFVLIVPEQKSDEHVRILADLARMFNDEDLCFTLRQTENNEDLYHIVITYQGA
ncbi:MAG: PTS IIA-like nitrogen regulatory protein PtsN [Pseudohongiellaceae bacterium]